MEKKTRLIDADELAHKFLLMPGHYRKAEIDLIDSAPTVDAEPVIHARWVLRQSNGYAVCSHCQRGDHVDPLATHCRYCGAKMDQE